MPKVSFNQIAFAGFENLIRRYNLQIATHESDVVDTVELFNERAALVMSHEKIRTSELKCDLMGPSNRPSIRSSSSGETIELKQLVRLKGGAVPHKFLWIGSAPDASTLQRAVLQAADAVERFATNVFESGFETLLPTEH